MNMVNYFALFLESQSNLFDNLIGGAPSYQRGFRTFRAGHNGTLGVFLDPRHFSHSLAHHFEPNFFICEDI